MTVLRNIKPRSILDMNVSESGDDASPLLKRRINNMGAASILFYREPLELSSASGAWLTAEDGRRYLDLYNNVPSVGHCHPHVVSAVQQQMARLNTHSRYLTDVVESYLERLRASFPDHLDNVIMTCSGSEANDLAMRIATRFTGNQGFIVTETAYHGNTSIVADVSPASWKAPNVPNHVRLVPAPSRYSYGDSIAEGFASSVAQAAAELQAEGYGLAALICDSVFSSDGVHADPVGFLQTAVRSVHDAGGLYIADEVQPGFGRLGHGMWGFSRHGVAPDIVTMGKPMGNGFPMAGLAARSSLIDLFCADTGYFNTFGGNPVAAAAGAAVLDIIEGEGLIENAKKVGDYLKRELSSIAADTGAITEIRGAGLFIGIELSTDRPEPGKAIAQLVDDLRQGGVITGAAGRFGETLKIRPPLSLSMDDAAYFLEILRRTLCHDSSPH